MLCLPTVLVQPPSRNSASPCPLHPLVQASNQLKTEGNQLHAQGRFEEAVAKYERARSNVEAFSGKEAADLARACTLNLSSCYLNLKQYDKCIEQCNTVLAGGLREGGGDRGSGAGGAS